MSCRQAFEIDLAAMLRGDDGAELRAFRDHYPRCADCAAEVDAWTAVHGLLTATAVSHPTPKKLLWFVDRPQSLSAGDRDGIAAHVAGCRSCRDELKALEGLDLHALTRPLAGLRTEPVRVPLPTPPVPLPWWRTIGWPQLAFVMVAMGIVPLLTSRLAMPPQPPMSAPANDSAPAAEATPSVPAPVATGETAPAERKLESKVVRSAPSGGPKTREAHPHESAPRHEAPAAPAPPPPPVATGGVRPFTDEGANDGNPALLARPQQAQPGGAALGRAAESGGGTRLNAEPAPAAEKSPPEDADAAPGRTVRLHPGHTTHVAFDDRATLTLRVAPHAGVPSTTEAEVRIVDAARRRELRQQGTLESGAVATTLPGGWLTPGEYQVEVDAGGVLAIYRFTVDARPAGR